MTDKTNIVIKVKYPVSGKVAEKLAPKMVTEWNVRRILVAAGVLVLILAVLFYVINNDVQDPDPDIVSAVDKQAAPQGEVKEAENISTQEGDNVSPSVKSIKKPNKINTQTAAGKEVIKKQANKEQAYLEVNHNVSRASLTYKIDNKEPVGEVVRTIGINRKKPVWVYYFTELKAMKDKRVYHEWLKNGVMVSRQALVISGDSWRTSSRKLLSGSDKGNWAVRLVDEKGRLLNEKKFKVE